MLIRKLPLPSEEEPSFKERIPSSVDPRRPLAPVWLSTASPDFVEPSSYCIIFRKLFTTKAKCPRNKEGELITADVAQQAAVGSGPILGPESIVSMKGGEANMVGTISPTRGS